MLIFETATWISRGYIDVSIDEMDILLFFNFLDISAESTLVLLSLLQLQWEWTPPHSIPLPPPPPPPCLGCLLIVLSPGYEELEPSPQVAKVT